MNNSLTGKLTLVTAPAGFGKTTLVTEWLSNGLPDGYRERIGWLSLDSGDNSAVQFWNYMIAALQTVDASLGKVSQTALQSSAVPPVRAVLTNLINEIAAMGDPLILCLDDYHEVNIADIHEGLEFLIENLPANMHLAAISLKNAADKSEFVQAFAGSHRFLTDYLVDEVLSRQTPEVQKFLRRTSLLERSCAGLCDELVEDVDSRDILRQLDRSNLFLVPLDNDQRWFRYHHLFSKFLNLQLYEKEPDIIPELYRRAADWFEREGSPRDTLHYNIDSGRLHAGS
ncbi:MAG: hypothetical protein JXJ17_01775 [Anaerolineae bacterium]|nr:hypothetical protein [Anaerolineae bacterium]